MSSPQRGVSARSTLTASPECMLRRTTYGSRGRSFSRGCRLRPARGRGRASTARPAASAVGPVRPPNGPAAQVRRQPSVRCSEPGHDLADDPAAVARNAQGHPLAPELVVQVGDRRAAVGEAEHLEGGRDGVVVVGSVRPTAHGDHGTGTHEQGQGVEVVALAHPSRDRRRPVRPGSPPSGRRGRRTPRRPRRRTPGRRAGPARACTGGPGGGRSGRRGTRAASLASPGSRRGAPRRRSPTGTASAGSSARRTRE